MISPIRDRSGRYPPRMRTPFARPARSFAGTRALVTGGASGLGLELVRLLAADGARVLATDQHDAAPEGVLPDGVEYRRLDVRSDAQWEAARDWVRDTWGGLDLLVNNAGVAAGGRIEVASMDEWTWIVDINLLGVVRGCRTFTPMMKQARAGHLVNVASLAGLVHAPSMSSYNAVKAGVVAVSETLRHELAPWDIDVSVICPSFFRTNLAASLRGADTDTEAGAVQLIQQAPRSAAQVARVAYAAIGARRFLVLTDDQGRLAVRAKRFARPAYDAAMIAAARRIADGDPVTPQFLAGVQTRLRRVRTPRPQDTP